MPETVRQCYCCAAHGLVRAVWAKGLCLACAVLQGMCEQGHQMAAKYEAAGDD